MMKLIGGVNCFGLVNKDTRFCQEVKYGSTGGHSNAVKAMACQIDSHF